MKHFNDLMNEIEEFGKVNDKLYDDKSFKMRNIAKTSGQFLGILIEMTNARRILEIGTSNGYSTLWIANSLKKVNGNVTTIEFMESKVELAEKNFNMSGLAEFINLVHGDAGEFIANCESSSFDMIFLDSDRKEYVSWWNNLKRVIAPGGIIVMDNAVSHVSELTDFIKLVEETDECKSWLFPIDSGLYIIKF